MLIQQNSTTLQVNVEEILQNFSDYLQQVEYGRVILITKSGKAIAEITPVTADKQTQRPYGLCAGEFTVPDNFDDPLPESILTTPILKQP